MAIDTDILIWYLRGHEGAKEFLAGTAFHSRVLGVISFIELLQGCRDKRESRQVQSFVDSYFEHVAPLTEAVSATAVSLTRKYAISHGLRTADALIAALAIENSCDLATGNPRHFRFIPQLALVRFTP